MIAAAGVVTAIREQQRQRQMKADDGQVTHRCRAGLTAGGEII